MEPSYSRKREDSVLCGNDSDGYWAQGGGNEAQSCWFQMVIERGFAKWQLDKAASLSTSLPQLSAITR